MEKLPTGSKEHIAENMAALKQIFPDAFGENGIDFDVLRQLLNDAAALDEGTEKFGLSWHGKRLARQIALTATRATLKPCRTESSNWDTTQNLFIEGDNLEVLKVLQHSYAQRVKMIYIDPPYNTGKEFIYLDKWKEGLDSYLRYTGQKDDEGITESDIDTAGRTHSAWLNMMYPRLHTARKLLCDDGVIFISIDDKEQAHLKKMCDEIFGEENLVAHFSIKTPNQTEDKNKLKNMDFLFVYAKSIDFRFNAAPKAQTARCTIGKPTQTQSDIEFPAGLEVRGVPDGYYENPKSTDGYEDITLTSGRLIVENGTLKEPVTLSARWSNPNDIKKFCKKFMEGSEEPIFNKFGKELRRLWLKGERFQPQMDKVGYELPESMWLTYTKKGSDSIKDLFGISLMEYPKHPELIEKIITLGADKDSIILDFFAGSATTAHAVMNANKDGGNRTYIMVQLPELCGEKTEPFKAGYTTIAEIGKERIRRAAQKIEAENPDYRGDLGFKVFKLDESSIKEWHADADDIERSLMEYENRIKEGTSKEELMYEIMLNRGVPLTAPIETRTVGTNVLYNINEGYMCICLDEVIARSDIEKISRAIIDSVTERTPPLEGQAPKKYESIVIFRDSAFENDEAKINMAETLKQNRIHSIYSI